MYRKAPTRREDAMAALASQIINHGHGLLDVSLASYNAFVTDELPRMPWSVIDGDRPTARSTSSGPSCG